MKAAFYYTSLWCLIFCVLQSCHNDYDTSLSTNYGFNLLKSKKTGVNFNNQLSSTPELNILKYLYFYNGAGVCVADFNQNGLPDLFFTGNQVQNQLYINQGALKFTNTTAISNIPKSHWSTGVTAIDINQDGLMDIYICQVDGVSSQKSHNQLLVNQGNNENGVPVFKEMAKAYGLNISSYAQQAVFFDFDLDGDLDLFLLNHSMHPNRTYGNGDKRTTFDAKAGDKLFENIEGKFVEITEKSNIFSSIIGYGLDLSLGDVNLDGYPDIYVGNDFFENDYLYINQQNGTFKDLISSNEFALGHTSHFSMGNDIADINNDLWPDIFSVDMLPQTTQEYKVSGADYPYLTYQQFLKNNYAPQYMSNTLHLNSGNFRFSEVANQNKIAASDWSWSALIADFNNDMFNDIFIANGIVGATNNMDFINFISDKTFQNKINAGLTNQDLVLLEQLPSYKKHNKLLLNNQNLTFNDVFDGWQEHPTSFSNGATYADLDNDGDLDIIVNNINGEVFIYENLSELNYLKIKFQGNGPNLNGIGTKVVAFVERTTMLRENFINKGYMSSTLPEVHFGFDKYTKVDSLWVIWPNQKYQSLKGVSANQTLTVNQDDALTAFDYAWFKKAELFTDIASEQIAFKHHEYESYEFSRQPLIPYMSSNLGPKITVADINNDGLDDVFIGNAKKQSSQLWVQQPNGSFKLQQEALFEKHKTNEDLDQVFVDVDNDGDLDLIVVSGGNEFKSGPTISPRLYLNKNGNFEWQQYAFENIYGQFNTITVADVNNDGFLDVFIGAGINYQTFGESPKSYLLINNRQNGFSDQTEKYFGTHNLGMIRDAKFTDLYNNGETQLIIVGHWMPVTIYQLEHDKFKNLKINAFKDSDGLYNTIELLDLENNGKLDMLIGNFGTNTKLQASKNEPLTLYIADFNNNGSNESILTYYHQNKRILFNTKDELAAQIPEINKRFRSYESFAKADIEAILEKHTLKNAVQKHVFNLKTVAYKNLGDFNFQPIELPQEAQYSSINVVLSDNINNDGKTEIILAGNKFDINTQLGRLDANHGLMLNYKNGQFSTIINHNLNLKGQINSAVKINLPNEQWYIFGTNNDSLQIVKKIK